MARRRLLTGEQWAKFLAVPNDERELVRYYTLGRDDLDAIATKRTARSRLGYAVLLCYLRHPGRVPDPDEMPPPVLLSPAKLVPNPTTTPIIGAGARRDASRWPTSWRRRATGPSIAARSQSWLRGYCR